MAQDGICDKDKSVFSDHFTVKLDVVDKDFAERGFLISTPKVPSANADSSVVGRVNFEYTVPLNNFLPEEVDAKRQKTSSDHNEKEAESPLENTSQERNFDDDSGERMPPPKGFATPVTFESKDKPLSFIDPPASSNQVKLSPIMEASRDSSSSSSDNHSAMSFNCQRSSVHSNFFTNVTRAAASSLANYDDTKTPHVSRGKHSSVSSNNMTDVMGSFAERTKSGYLADKSRFNADSITSTREIENNEENEDDLLVLKPHISNFEKVLESCRKLTGFDVISTKTDQSFLRGNSVDRILSETKEACIDLHPKVSPRKEILSEPIKKSTLEPQEEKCLSEPKREIVGGEALDPKGDVLDGPKTGFRLFQGELFEPNEEALSQQESDVLSELRKKNHGEPLYHNAKPLQTSLPNEKFAEDIDPFSSDVRQKLLQPHLAWLRERKEFVELKQNLPSFKAKTKVLLGTEKYSIKRCCGSGAYAQVFFASTSDPMNQTVFPDIKAIEKKNSEMILKVEKPASLWEFYICCELRRRLKRKYKESESSSSLDSFQRINYAYFFQQGSVLISQFCKFGTVLDMINGYKKHNKSIPEKVACIFLIDIVKCLKDLHDCNIIHADLKPDNVMLTSIPECAQLSSEIDPPRCVQFIDFGRSIDLQLFTPGTAFTKKVTTDGFTCCEMREGRPWTFHTDYYGLAAIAHCLLWGSYMRVEKCYGIWSVTGVSYRRNMRKEFWTKFFHDLLNIKSDCERILDLSSILSSLRDAFAKFDCPKSEYFFLSSVLNQMT